MSDALCDLLGRRAWVTVTNPVRSSSWSGQLIAMHSDPGVIIEQADGVRMCLPQSFTIAECEPQEPSGPAAALANAERIIADRDADIADLMATVADYENRITWNTSCGSCALLLDSCRSADERAEQAEAKLAERDAEVGSLVLDAHAAVPVTFLRQVLTDAIRACESDVLADGEAMQGLLAEYRAELAGLPAVTT